MNKEVEVLVNIVYDKVKEDLKKKDIKKECKLFYVYNKNTYVNIDKFCEMNKEYFGIDADSVKRNWHKKSLLDYNGNKYVPFNELEEFAILYDNKLYINRDELDKFIFLYIMERMDIKQLNDSFKEQIKVNKTGLIKELYEVSNAHFQRESPVFQDIRVGHNSQSKITM